MASPDNNTATAQPSAVISQFQRLQSRLQHRLHRYQQEASRQYHNGELAASWRIGTEKLGQCFANADATAATAAGYGSGVLTYLGCKYAGTVALAALRISSAQPIIGRVAGLVLVPLSGVVASHAMCYTAGRVAEQRQIPRQHYPFQAAQYRQWYDGYVTTTHQRAQQLSADWRNTVDHTDVHSFHSSYDTQLRRRLTVDSAVYAALALLSYKLLRGKLQHVAPSDLYKVGSYMRHTLPAFRGSQYASSAEKQVLQVFGRKYGCHHCGMRYGRMLSKLANRRWLGGFIGDHIPPNKYAHGSKSSSSSGTTAVTNSKVKQLFLPQCTSCSSKQSAAVRDDIRTLVLPRSLRWRDLFLPLPLVALLVLPAISHIDERVEEREQAEQSVTSKLRRWLAR